MHYALPSASFTFPLKIEMSQSWVPDASWLLNNKQDESIWPEATYDDASLWTSWIPQSIDQAVPGSQDDPILGKDEWHPISLAWEEDSLFWMDIPGGVEDHCPEVWTPPELNATEVKAEAATKPAETRETGSNIATSSPEVQMSGMESSTPSPGLEAPNIPSSNEAAGETTSIMTYYTSGRVPGHKTDTRRRRSILKREAGANISKEEALKVELASISNILSTRLSKAQHEAVLMIHRHILLRPVKNGQPHYERRTFCSDTSGKRDGLYVVDARYGVISHRSGLVNRTHGKVDAKTRKVDSEFSAADLGFQHAEWLWLCIPGAPNPCHPKHGEPIRRLLQTGEAAAKKALRSVRFSSPLVTKTWKIPHWRDHDDRRKRKEVVRKADLEMARGPMPEPEIEFPSPQESSFELVWQQTEESLNSPWWDEFINFDDEEEI